MALGTVNRGADYLRHPTSCGKPGEHYVDRIMTGPAGLCVCVCVCTYFITNSFSLLVHVCFVNVFFLSLSLSLSLSLNSVPLMVDVGIIDPATKQKVPNGERGEVCIKGAMIMKVSVCVCVC